MKISFILSMAAVTILILLRTSCIETHITLTAIKDAKIACTIKDVDIKIMTVQ
jgi:hypothetical protein